MKQNKGITLVALVVTIIILLILSGIVITQLTGDNGLFSRAKQAKEDMEKAQASEKMNIILIDINADLISKNEEINISNVANSLILDDSGEIEYVYSVSQVAALTDILPSSTISEIYVKLTEYKYEFKINSDLKIVNTLNVSDKDKENKKYKITYNANGGTGLMENEEKIEGTSSTILENSFIAPSDKKFKEWNTSQDGTGITYKPGQTYEIDKDLTLYAIWRDSRVYLYNNGTINTDLVGNFIAEDRYLWGASKATKVPTLNLNSDSMYIAQRSTNTNEYSSGDVISTKAINLSDFDTFTINFTNVSNASALTNIQNGSSGQIVCCFSDQQIKEFYGQIDLVRGRTMNQSYECRINVSELNNSCYLAFRAIGTYFTSDIVATNVLNMYLE